MKITIKYKIIILLNIAVLIFLYGCARQMAEAPENSTMALMPYWYNGTWVFDDERANLSREAFVAGIPDMINHITKDIPNARKGFRLLFSSKEFPGYQIRLTWVRKEGGGNWYYSEEMKKEGWLCPALFRYFKEAPKEIYAKAEPINK